MTSATLEGIQAVWRRRKWLVIVVFILPFAGATTGLLWLPVLYRATVIVDVERQQVPETFVRSVVTSELESRLQAISRDVLGRSSLEQLIDRFGLYGQGAGQVPDAGIVEQMRRDIQLEIKSPEAKGGARSGPVAFALSYRSFDRQTVARVAQALASLYVGENRRIRERQTNGTIEFLTAQIAETKARLDAQEGRISEFKQRHLGELPQQLPANLTTLESLNVQLRLNGDSLMRALERRDALAAQLDEAEASDGSSIGPGPLELQLARLKQERLAARLRYTDEHPAVLRLNEEIAALERELGARKPRVEAERTPDPSAPPRRGADRLREALRAADFDIKMLKAEDQRLRGAIAAYQARIESTPRREQGLLTLSRDYDSTREAYQSLLKRLDDAQMTASLELDQKGEQLRIKDLLDPATVAVAPRRLMLLMAVLALSVALATGVTMLIETVDTSFHSTDELRSFTAFPVLASIPRMVTESDRRRRRLRFQLVGGMTLLGVVIIAGAAYVAARGNESLVRVLDRDRPDTT